MLSGWRSLPILLVIDNLSLCWAQGFRLWNFLSLLSCSAPTRHLGIHPLTPPSAGSSSTSRARWPQAHPRTGLTRSHTHTVHMFTHTQSTCSHTMFIYTESTHSHTHTHRVHMFTHTQSPHVHTHTVHMFTHTHTQSTCSHTHTDTVHMFTHNVHIYRVHTYTPYRVHTHTHTHTESTCSHIHTHSPHVHTQCSYIQSPHMCTHTHTHTHTQPSQGTFLRVIPSRQQAGKGPSYNHREMNSANTL